MLTLLNKPEQKAYAKKHQLGKTVGLLVEMYYEHYFDPPFMISDKVEGKDQFYLSLKADESILLPIHKRMYRLAMPTYIRNRLVGEFLGGNFTYQHRTKMTPFIGDISPFIEGCHAIHAVLNDFFHTQPTGETTHD